MCDTYIPEIGYVCGECQDEFKRWVNHKDQLFSTTTSTEYDIREKLKQFMTIWKIDKDELREMDVGGFFEKYTSS